MALDVIRMLMLATEQKNCSHVKVRVNEKVASYLNNQKRKELADLEGRGSMDIAIMGSEAVFPEFLELKCYDSNDAEVRLPIKAKG
jgi:ribonuclease E